MPFLIMILVWVRVLNVSHLTQISVSNVAHDKKIEFNTPLDIKYREVSILPELQTNILEIASQNVESESNFEPEETKEELISLGIFKITYYCSCYLCCGKTDGITASGTVATEGRTIAADTSIIPMGTNVIIDGNSYIVEDRGGAIKNKKIDIFVNSHSRALDLGVRNAEVFVKIVEE